MRCWLFLRNLLQHGIYFVTALCVLLHWDMAITLNYVHRTVALRTSHLC
jgi:hypothetical protein